MAADFGDPRRNRAGCGQRFAQLLRRERAIGGDEKRGFAAVRGRGDDLGGDSVEPRGRSVLASRSSETA